MISPIRFIEKNYWIFLVAGLAFGLSFPIYIDLLMQLLEPVLMVMLLLVFLKADFIQIFSEIKNYKLMSYLAFAYMIFIPTIFFLVFQFINYEMAIGIMLLTSMPAAVASTTFSDILKGNVALSTGITFITSIIAPFSIPLIFGLLSFETLSIDAWVIFKDLSIIIFVPMIASQVLRKYYSEKIKVKTHQFTAINILLLSFMVYVVIGSQRDMVLSDSLNVFIQIAILYLVFIFLHLFGYLLAYRQNRKNKISITIGAAYMNNGLAIVLAAKYFDPSVLLLIVLSDLPWNTMLIPFSRVMKLLKDKGSD